MSGLNLLINQFKVKPDLCQVWSSFIWLKIRICRCGQFHVINLNSIWFFLFNSLEHGQPLWKEVCTFVYQYHKSIAKSSHKSLTYYIAHHHWNSSHFHKRKIRKFASALNIYLYGCIESIHSIWMIINFISNLHLQIQVTFFLACLFSMHLRVRWSNMVKSLPIRENR